MAPTKKREKDASTPNAGALSSSSSSSAAADTVKMNGHLQEHEMFLQAFEKPTQIYRFLKNRHSTRPIYINRTLGYMKERMSRNNKRRATFKVDSILELVKQKTELVSNNFVNIIYDGLYDKGSANSQWWNAGDIVCVESTLFKITKSKRKDSTSDFQELLSQKSNISYNPQGNTDLYAAINIPVNLMQPLTDQHIIFKLLFCVRVTPGKNEGNDENLETPNKRSKTAIKIFSCELIVYEKNIGFILSGDYEASLQEYCSSNVKSFSPKKRTWETLPDNYVPLSTKYDDFSQSPSLKFRLTWSARSIPATINAEDLIKYNQFSEAVAGPNGTSGQHNAEAHINNNNNNNNDSFKNSTIKAEKIQIVYNFLYSNNTCQQTEYTQEVICPWCGLDCLRLYALLKHLKLCHARFNFTYQPAGSGARIDVTINDSYDGSYAGSPYDLAGPSGCSFARTCGPVRRTTVTNLLVWRPRRQKTCLDEFLVLDEDELSNQRSYITGHNRLYHHTETCLPVHPKELDIDSEGESDPLWLRQKTIQMIDEFSDVNEGEKELMKMWNLHVMKHGFVGDCQLPLACDMFLDANGHEIIRKNLYRNFILHMCSLFDYGLISPETVSKSIQKLQGILSKYEEGRELMSKQHEAQLKYWLEVGIHKQDEQKLKSPQKQPSASNTNAGSVNATVGEAGANLDVKAMHPPAKRTVATVKRGNLHLANGIGASDKLIAATAAKPAAKKSVTQSQTDESTLTGREKRFENGLRRSANGGISAEKERSESNRADKNRTAEARLQAVKRRLSIRDAQQDQPLLKRKRSEGAVGTTTRSSLSRDNAIGTTTLPTRQTTRRQSMVTAEAAAANKVAGRTTQLSLRTRLSLPLPRPERR